MCEESTHNQWLCDSDTNSKLLIPGQNIDAKTEEEDEERKKTQQTLMMRNSGNIKW